MLHKELRIRIAADLDNLTQEEHLSLSALLLKAGFTNMGTEGGLYDFVLTLEGPEIEVSESVWDLHKEEALAEIARLEAEVARLKAELRKEN